MVSNQEHWSQDSNPQAWTSNNWKLILDVDQLLKDEWAPVYAGNVQTDDQTHIDQFTTKYHSHIIHLPTTTTTKSPT